MSSEQGPYSFKFGDGKWYAGFSDLPIGSPESNHRGSAFQDASYWKFYHEREEAMRTAAEAAITRDLWLEKILKQI